MATYVQLVFIGQNIKDLYKNDSSIFNDFFDEDEIKTILDNNIDVFYHSLLIYIDDTIETIKKKLISVNDIAFEEIYFFYTYSSRIKKDHGLEFAHFKKDHERFLLKTQTITNI